MKKKVLKTIVVLSACACMAGGLTACGTKDDASGQNPDNSVSGIVVDGETLGEGSISTESSDLEDIEVDYDISEASSGETSVSE